MFIQFDETSANLTIDGVQTQSESTAGTYIYRITTTSSTSEPLTLQELDQLTRSLGLSNAGELTDSQRFAFKRTERTHSVVIRLYFPTAEIEDFLEDLPFYKASISGRSQTGGISIRRTSMSRDDMISVFASHYSPKEIETISSWSEGELITAIDEAWARK